MTTDGGGWTHVMNLNGANATNYDGAEVFETKSVFGSMSDDNYLNAGFYSVEFTESYLVDETYNTIVISDSTEQNKNTKHQTPKTNTSRRRHMEGLNDSSKLFGNFHLLQHPK